jgi:isoleucyl-tRNA synthetase
LKFDIAGVDEVRRKFFGTLYNTYSFFALYANIDGFTGEEAQVDIAKRPEIDRWIISLLNTLVKEVTDAYESYEPTRAGRAIQDFVMENLSNWYVRLNRKRFWGGEMNEDKLAAYQTLFECLKTVTLLSAPIAPFFTDRLYCDLMSEKEVEACGTVHLATFPKADETLIDSALEQRMYYAQSLSSMILALRRKVNIKVRQPLQKIMVPVLDEQFAQQIKVVQNLILAEVNVKELELLTDTEGVIKKKIKANFKTLGPKYSKLMKQIAAEIAKMTSADIARFEREGSYALTIGDETIVLAPEDAEITAEDIEGLLVANEGKLTVALDVNVTPQLREEGIAREFINRIQNIRKDSGLDVTDKIRVSINRQDSINSAVDNFGEYIGQQTLAVEVSLTDGLTESNAVKVELDDEIVTYIQINKI